MNESIATNSSWKTLPLKGDYDTIALKIELTKEEIDNLKKGHIPYSMEDHWFTYYEDNKYYCHRSWTGICIFIVEINETKITKAIVNRNPDEYKSTNNEKDKYLLEYLIYSQIGRSNEAKEAIEKSF